MVKCQKVSVKFLLLGTAAAVLFSGGALVSAPNTANAADAHVTFMGGQTKGAFNRVVSGWAAMVTKQMTVANGNKNLVAKLHPGAAKFWKEMGKKVM